MRHRPLLLLATILAILFASSCTIRIGPTQSPATITTGDATRTTGSATTSISPTISAAPSTAPPGPYTRAQLVQYVLGLINADRAAFNQAPVVLGTNQAAQRHAEDMLQGYFLSHWGTDGLKPYMRYTVAGGVNYEMENSAYAGFGPTDNPNSYAPLDARSELHDLEYAMMYNDQAENNGHRDNILYPWHKKVNIGIAWDQHRLAFVEQFEGDYVQFTQLPALSGNMLAMQGSLTLGKINGVAVYYDPTPQPLTYLQLSSGPHSYTLGNGNHVAFIYPPAPLGSYYPVLPADGVQASRWRTSVSPANVTTFDIQADLGTALTVHGAGVYTVVILSSIPDAQNLVEMTNYSLFVN